MINRTQLDQFEEAIEVYEDGWTESSFDSIRSLLETYALSNNQTALVELIRVDIELRHGEEREVDLEKYFAEFPSLLKSHESVAQIAFEDFRSRTMNQKPIEFQRWENLPGIQSEIWFQQLAWEASSHLEPSSSSRISFTQRPPLDGDCDIPESNAAFLNAMAAAGFHIITEIGVGAFSRVYLATQKKLADRYVVLKVVNQHLLEPQRMALLQHTNIVQVHSVHRILSRCVICMPYAGSLTLKEYMSESEQREGHSLVATVRRKVESTIVKCGESLGIDTTESYDENRNALTPAANESAVLKPLEKLNSLKKNEFTIWLFSRLASALSHAHGRGVMHGDLKPGNVLIRNDGEPALIDFNLSRTLNRTDDQNIGGTLAYMSPETMSAYIGNREAVLDEQADLYGIGAVLFEFATGRLPFRAPATRAELDVSTELKNRMNTGPAWEPTDSISAGLKSIINRCLEFEAKNRYASAADLREDLEREGKYLPLLHARETFFIRAKKRLRENSRLIGSAAAVLALASLIPLGMKASQYRNDNLRMTAEDHFDHFAKKSALTISQLMADPIRHSQPQVDMAIAPLREYGILNGSGMAAFESPSLLPDQKMQQRNTLLRHVVHVAYAETDRLRPLVTPVPPNRTPGALNAEDLQRLDQLITTAEKIHEGLDSRSINFLKAIRAELSGNAFKELVAKASDTKIESDTETYLEAIRLMSERREDDALQILNTLADRDAVPSHLRWTMIGMSHFRSARYEDASIAFTQSIERAPDNSRLWLLRGICYQRERKNERAETDFRRTLELEPDLAMSWLRLAMCCLVANRVEEAFEHIEHCLTLSPDNAQALLVRSRALLRRGKKEESKRDYEKALLSTNVSANTLSLRGREMMSIDPELAIESFKQAYALEPTSRTNLKKWAKTLSLYLNQTEEALEILDITIELYPDFKSAIIDRAVLRSQLGEYELAKQDIARALDDTSGGFEFYQAACASALVPEPRCQEDALTYLAKSVHKGYEPTDMANDPDLATIRESEEFKTILRSYRLATSK